MADLLSFVDDFIKDGYPYQIARDPRVQFGTPQRQYLGAQILPEQTSDTNAIIEDLARFEIVIANDGDPLSPPQIKQSAGGAELIVRLGHIDIATQMDARDMRRLANLVDGNDRAAAESFFARWLTRAVRLGLSEKAESQRWQLLADAQVSLNYLDQPSRIADFPSLSPDGHRVTVPSGTEAAPAGWYADDFDPMAETIIPLVTMLKAKGYMPTRIVTSTNLLQGVLASNPEMQRRSGGTLVINSSGSLENANGDLADTSRRFLANGMPAPVTYDLHYRTQTGSQRFLPDDKFIILCTTGRDAEIDLGDDGVRVIEDTFGYYGVGVSEGQSTPGAVITPKYSDVKPVGVYAEGYLEGFPILLEPEAIAVVTVPAPAAA